MINALYKIFRDWSSGGSVYVIADPHFGDEDMNFRYEKVKKATEESEETKKFKEAHPELNVFPLDCYDLSEKTKAHMIGLHIVNEINKVAKKADTLIMLGDIGNPWYVKQLKAGHKVLIKGNHDKGESTYSNLNLFLNEPPLGVNDNTANSCTTLPVMLGSAQEKQVLFEQELFEYPTFYALYLLRIAARKKYGKNCQVENIIYVSEEDALNNYHISKEAYEKTVFAVCSFRALFDEIYDGPLMVSDKLMLSHEPVQGPWMNLHGHTHSEGKSEVVYKEMSSDGLTERYTAGFYNLCAEKLDFVPLNLGEFIRQGNLSEIKNIHRIAIDRASKK